MKKILLFILFSIFFNVNAQIKTIINKDVEEKQITKTELKALYLLQTRRLMSGNKVTLFQLPNESKIHKAFVREVLGMSVETYLQEIDKVTNAGLATPVFVVNTKDELISRVTALSNAISYIDSDYLIINVGINNIRILKIVD